MKIGKFSLNLTSEVMVKVSKEVLTLFGIIVTGDDPDFDEMAVRHELLTDPAPRVRTKLSLTDQAGRTELYECESAGDGEEPVSAAFHRLVKLNFYQLLRRYCGMPPAPWGILYGVRPVKIVHRYMERGMDRAAIERRLAKNFAVTPEKARLLTDVARRQRPCLLSASAKDVSIYIGIPFCLSRCLYCSFPANLLPNEARLADFMQILEKDMRAVRSALTRYDLRVQSIYIGGGTPTSLPDHFFAALMEAVRQNFYSAGVAEVTVEAGRPDSMSPGKIKTLKDYHVTRVSVNPQTMQARTLKRIGRSHTPEDIVTMYHDLRTAGIASINMDVIVGLPGETRADMADTMAKLATLAPDDITLHTLALKRGSRLKMNLSETELPTDEEVRAMYAIARESVARQGMEPYYLYRQGYQSGQLENVGCARPGAESLYNIQIMGERQTILGIGGAATSKIVNPRTKRMKAAFNAKDLRSYLENIDTYIEKRASLLAEAYE